MRLKLNRTLRAALIAAITTVGCTLTQAQAASYPGESILDGNWFYTKAKAHDYLEGSDVDTINLTAEESGIVASITTVTAKAGGILRIVGGNVWGGNRSFADLQIDTLKAGSDGAGEVFINTRQYTDSYNPNGANATIKTVQGKLSGVDNYAFLTLGSTGQSISTSGTIHNFGGATLTLCGTMSAANVTVDSGSTLKLANANLLTVTGNLTMAAGSIMDVSHISASDTPVVLGTYAGSATCDNVQIVGAQKGYSAALSASDNQLLLTFSAIKPLVWNGTSDKHNWNDAVWDEGKTFTADADAAFTSAGHSEVSITSAVQANFVTVNGQDYTFTLSDQGGLTVAQDLTVEGVKLSIAGSGAVSAANIYASDATIEVGSGISLTATSLIAEDGKKASIAGTGTITLSSLVGDINIAEGATVTTNSNVSLSSTNTLSVTGPGTLRIGNMTASSGTHTLGSGISMGDLEISGSANVTFSGKLVNISGTVHTKANNNTTLAFGSGDSATTAVVGRLELDDAQNGGTTNFIVNKQAKVVVTSTNNKTGYKEAGFLFSEWGQSTHAQVAGELYSKDAMLSTGDKAATIDITGTVATKGIRGLKQVNNTINLNGGKLVLGDSGITADNNGNWAINLNGGEVGITANATIARAINVAGAVTFNTDKYTWSGTDADQTLTQGQDGGTLTISANITGTGTITKTGAGELVLTGGANVLSNTIQVQGGTLTMTGTYEIGDIKGGDIQEYYVDVNGNKATNGFYCQAGSKTVYNAASGTTVNDNGVKYTIGGLEVDVTGGVCTIDPTVNYTTLWVKEGSEAFAAYKTKAGEALTTVDLAAGTSVTMDSAGASITLAMHGNATVNATANTTLNSISGWSGNTLTITGTAATVSSPAALILDEAGDILRVEQGVALDIAGKNNLTIQHGEAIVNGTVTIGHEIDLSKGSTSDGKLTIGSTGSVTTKDGMWLATTALGVLLEQGGTLAITEKGVKFTGKEGSGSIKASGAEVNYSADDTNALVNNVVMEATGDIAIANQLTNVDVVTSAHRVTLNNAASSYANVTVSGTGSLVIAADSNISGTSSLGTGVTINSASTLTNGGTMSIDGTIVFGQKAIQNTGSITLGESIHFNLTGMTAVDNKYTLFSGNAVDLSKYDASRITISGSKDAYNWTFGQDGTISFSLISYKWNGGETGVWDYVTSNWNDPAVPFVAGYAAQFDTSATVAVTGAIEASKVIVSAGNVVTLTEGADGYLTADELAVEGTLNTAVTVVAESYTIAQGGTWNIQGEQALVDGINEGTIHVDTTGDVMVWSDTPETALAGVKNDGKVGVALANDGSILNMGESNGTLEVYSGAISYLSHLDNQTVELDSGSKLLFGNNAGTKDAAVFANDIVMNGDATVQVWGSSKHSSATISGDVSGAGHTLTKTDGDQSLIFSGVVTLGGLTSANDGNGTIVFNGGAGSIGKIKTDGATTIQFSAKTDAANEYTFDTFNMAASATKQRWLIVDENVKVIGTGSDLGGNNNSTIASGWGVSGGGLRINGVLDLAGVISFDDANTSKIEGSGLINTAGLNISNGNTTTVQGGVKINITSATGIYKRDGGDSTLNLADATLMATTVDWELKSSVNNVNLTNSETGTTFDVATDRTVTISKVLGGEGKLVKTGDGTLVLSSNDTHTGGIDVQEGKLVVKGTIASDITMGANASIENQGAAPITLSNVDEQLKHIENTGAGEMVFMNERGLLSVVELTIGADSTVSFYDQAEIPVEGTVTITETLTAGGGTLKANLTIADADLEDGVNPLLNVNGGGDNALTLGSQFTIAEGTLVTLDAETIAALEGMQIGQSLDIIRALEETGLTYGEDGQAIYDGMWFGQLFERGTGVEGDYLVFATESAFGLTKVSNTPEPTTGTLSLLALMALAARRRRK